MKVAAPGAGASGTIQQGIVRAATIIALGNVLSRVVGYGRDIAISYYYGSEGPIAGYLTALKAVNSVYDLLISGVISAAFIPVFSELRDRREEFGRVASSILTATVVVMVLAMLLIQVFAVPLIAVLASGQAAVSAAAVADLRLMAPAILFLGVSGVLTALLYAKQRFVLPAFTPVIFNAAIVVAAVVLHAPLAINALVAGVLVGSAGQVVLQVNGLKGIHIRALFERDNPQVRRIGRLYTPVALGLIVTEAQVFLDLHLQNSINPNCVAWLYYGMRIYQLPLGLVVTAMSLASLPTLSVLSGRAFLETLTRGLKLVTMLIAPAVVLLAVLGTPIVAVSFHHGAYNLTDVVNAVAGLDFYLPGLWFVAIDQMLIFAFYAKNDTLTPVVVNLVSIAGYCLAALLGLDVFHLSFRGLAMADSVKQVIHAVTLFVLLWRWQGGLSGFGLGRLAGKVAVAAIVSAVVCMLALHHYHDGMQGLKLVAFTVVACSAGLAAYFGTLLALRTEEMQIIVNRLQTRLGRTA